jgi:gamma-glutamyl hercynylcysteine S-oxide hydrolase
MCRHLAYLGPPLPLSRLLFDPPHSLCHQSWAPRDMRGGGTINADGFGVGWWPASIDFRHGSGLSPADEPPGSAPHDPHTAGPGGHDPHRPHTAEPGRHDPHHPHTAGVLGSGPRLLPAGGVAVRYRRATPMWSDTTLPALAASVTVGAALAAVRSATVGMPVTETAAAPFGDGPWLFSHNGVVTGWPGSMAKPAATLPVTDLLTLEAPTDAALLWALVRDRLRAGAGPAEAVAGTVAEVERAAPGSRLNLLLTDGTSIVATAAGHALSVRRDAASILVSSEPLDDDPAWRPVPDRALLVAGTDRTLTITELGDR